MFDCMRVIYRTLNQQINLISKASNICSGSVHSQNSFLLPLTIIPSRNTFIVKRIHPVRLYKEGNKPKITEKNMLYEIVENTDMRPDPIIDVVLKSYVQGVGNDGDIISMNQSAAYNKLLVTGLAVYPTKENLEYSQSVQKDVKIQEKRLTPTEEFIVEFLKKRCMRIIMNKETEWTIEPWHIRSSFRKDGVQVLSDSQIELPSQPITGPNMGLQDKDFYVTLTVNKKHKVKVRCRIHHWATSPQDRLPLDPHFWENPVDLIFPEEKSSNTEEPKPVDST